MDYFGTNRAIATWVVTVMFMITFPWYFTTIEDREEIMSGGASGKVANHQVTFTEELETHSESAFVGDGEVYPFTFDLDSELMVGYITIEVFCAETDEIGVGLFDSASGEMDLSSISGYNETQSSLSFPSSSCNDQGAPIGTMQVQVVPDYDGTDYTTDEFTREELEAKWDDGGAGRGEYIAEIQVQVNSIMGFVTESGEEVRVDWAAHLYSYEVALVPEEPEV